MMVYNLDKIQSILNSAHPKQIVNKVENIKCTMFEVKYKYTTNRGNKKDGSKIFLLNILSPQADLSGELNEWAKDYNKNNIHRQISNVEFLESQCIGYINI